MAKFLFKQAYRAFCTQIKNYFGVIAAIIVIVAVGGYAAISQIYSSAVSLQDWKLELAVGCSVICLLVIILGKRPAFHIHPASIHLFSCTPAFIYLKALALVKKIVGFLIAAYIIGLIIYNFHLSMSLVYFSFCLAFYFISVSLIAWFKYNREKIGVWSTKYALATAAFLLSLYFNDWYSPVINAVIAALFILCYFKIRIDMSRYYEDSLYIERINSASRHKNMALMQQITADHIANKKHRLKLNSLPIRKNNVLFYKVLIETFRMSKQVVVVLLLFIVFAIVINRTLIFTQFPIIGDPNISELIGMLSLACFAVNLKEIYLKQILSALIKRKEGLFLPYKDTEVILSYSAVCSIVLFSVILVVSIILQSNPFCIVLSEIILLFGVNLVFWGKKRIQWITMVSNVIIFAATYFLF